MRNVEKTRRSIPPHLWEMYSAVLQLTNTAVRTKMRHILWVTETQLSKPSTGLEAKQIQTESTDKGVN